VKSAPPELSELEQQASAQNSSEKQTGAPQNRTGSGSRKNSITQPPIPMMNPGASAFNPAAGQFNPGNLFDPATMPAPYVSSTIY
jgi:hypothetical protein